MDCNHVYDRLQDYLDRELTEAEMADVCQHLSECPPCAQEFKFEASVLRHIKKCLETGDCPPELYDRVFDAIDGCR